MPTRIARTAWNGGLQDGQGQVELTSSKVGTYDVSFPRRAAVDAGGVTSPEERFAAALRCCEALLWGARRRDWHRRTDSRRWRQRGRCHIGCTRPDARWH